MTEGPLVGIGKYIIGEFYLPKVENYNLKDHGLSKDYSGPEDSSRYLALHFDADFFIFPSYLYFDHSRGGVLHKLEFSIKKGMCGFIQEGCLKRYGFNDSSVFQLKPTYSQIIDNKYGKIVIRLDCFNYTSTFQDFTKEVGGSILMWATHLSNTKLELDKIDSENRQREEFKRKSRDLFP